MLNAQRQMLLLKLRQAPAPKESRVTLLTQLMPAVDEKVWAVVLVGAL
jgi:hypothetical protein